MEGQNQTYVYVGYILSDYSHALWMSKDKEKVQKAIDKYRARGGRCDTWIERYALSRSNLIEFDCD